MRFLAAVLLLLAPAVPAFAATASAPSANYDVEVLVFAIDAPELEGAELWTRAQQPIDTADAALPANRAPSADFSRIATALQSDGHFRILLEKHWKQIGDTRSNVPAVHLASADNEINGIFRFYLSRFLHVELNIMFQPPSADTGSGTDATPDYVINEQRRIRSSELTYFDHPKFGVIVRVSPLPA